MQAYRKVYIKTLEELEKKRFHLFGCEIHIPIEVFNEMSNDLVMCLKWKNNHVYIDNRGVNNAKD